jgi:hypothetical protein
MIKDEIEAESTTSAHFLISHQFEPASAQVTRVNTPSPCPLHQHEEISIDVTLNRIFFGKIFGMGASIVAKMLRSDWLKKYQFSDRIFHRNQN